MENVTDPVGVPLAGLCGATVAVKVTGCPVTLGLLAEFSVVVVFPRWIVALRFPVLPLKLGSPEYEAEVTAYGESLACRPPRKGTCRYRAWTASVRLQRGNIPRIAGVRRAAGARHRERRPFRLAPRLQVDNRPR